MKKIILLFIVLVGYFATAQNPAKFRSGIDVTGQADITGTVILQPQAAPGSPVTGEVYYDSTQNQIFQWNGTSWTTLGGIDIQALTQAQYDGLSAQDKLEFVGYIVEPGTGQGDASDIDLVTAAFNLNLSGTETNVQLAIDKLDDLLVENMVPYTPAQYAALTQPQKDTLNAIIVDDTGLPGSLTDDQTAAEVPITDVGTYFTATDVEGALQELGAGGGGDGLGPDGDKGDITVGGVGTTLQIDADVITPTELDDDANSPTAGYAVMVETGAASFDYSPVVGSTTVGEPTGSDRIQNMVSLTQNEYDIGSPVSTTFYVITDAKTTYREAIAISDNTTALTTGTKMTWYSPPYAITITDAEASLLTAATGAGLIVDIHDDGTTIMATDKLDIDVSEFHTKDAATQPAISAGSIAAGSKLEAIIDQVGSTIAGAGAIVYIYYTID